MRTLISVRHSRFRFPIALGTAEGYRGCAIRYDVFVTDKKTGERFEQLTMEFVHFRDKPEPVGARVIEGWALSGLPLS